MDSAQPEAKLTTEDRNILVVSMISRDFQTFKNWPAFRRACSDFAENWRAFRRASARMRKRNPGAVPDCAVSYSVSQSATQALNRLFHAYRSNLNALSGSPTVDQT